MTKKRLGILFLIFLLLLVSKDTYAPLQVLPQNCAVVSSEKIIRGEDLNLGSLGKVPVYSQDREKLIAGLAETRRELDKYLPRHETFINVSDFSVQKLFERPQKLYYSEIFPVWGDDNQRKLLKEAEEKGVKAVLFGQKRSAMEIYPIYRKALLSLLPVELSEHYTLMLPPERLPSVTSGKAAIALLEKRFSKDLKYLPAVWGNNLHRLKSGTETVPCELRLVRISNDAFIYIPSSPVQGEDITMLFLQIQSVTAGVLEFSWQSELTDIDKTGLYCNFSNGIFLIPLDASPSWLLSRRITAIKIKLKTGKDIYREEGQDIFPTTGNTRMLKAVFAKRREKSD